MGGICRGFFGGGPRKTSIFKKIKRSYKKYLNIYVNGRLYFQDSKNYTIV